MERSVSMEGKDMTGNRSWGRSRKEYKGGRDTANGYDDS